jgi:hypothetical protein
MFISAAYVGKCGRGTNPEISALARALKEHGEYLLPARFDNTPVDGIRATVGYIGLAEPRARGTTERDFEETRASGRVIFPAEATGVAG